MLIEFRCGNYSRFDKETGQYVVCGQRMSASSQDAGLIVSCPRCKKECEVPIPGRKRSKKPAADDSSESIQLEHEALVAQGSQNAQPQTAAPPRSKTQRCPKCGGALDSRQTCKECRWVKPRYSKANQSLDEMKMEPAGMMLWFSQILSEGIPMKMLCLVANIAVPMLLIAFMMFSILVVKGFFGGLLFLVFFLALLLYIGLVFKGYQFLRSGHARLAWFQKPFWNGILAILRSRKWVGVEAKTKHRNVVDFHGEAITDASLIQRPEFRSAQVLDLEGTLITDATIEQLYNLKHLQCLVVRNTKASHLAVTRLQQSFPKLWVWH